MISNEMQKMQEQLKLLQAELCARGGGAPFDEVPVHLPKKEISLILDKLSMHLFFIDTLNRL